MAKIKVNTEYYLVLRRDILSCNFLSLTAKVVLSSLLILQEKQKVMLKANTICERYGITETELSNALEELAKCELISYSVLKEGNEYLPKIIGIAVLSNVNLYFYGALYDKETGETIEADFIADYAAEKEKEIAEEGTIHKRGTYKIGDAWMPDSAN